MKNVQVFEAILLIFSVIKYHRIHRTLFDTDGYINIIACPGVLSILSEEKIIMQAWRIKADDIIKYLETRPSDH